VHGRDGDEKEPVLGRTIGLVVKEDTKALRQADELERWLRSRGCRVVRKSSDAPRVTSGHTRSESSPAGFFCLLVLGGDGTFLSAVRWLGENQVPILGVKYGDLGFLAEANEERLYAAMDAVLNDQYSTRSRMRLNVEVWRRGKQVSRETVLNDVVINKGALARLAHIKTFVDDGYLTDYRADGLIVATPTGSTAYSLAAGGPIIHPAVPAILVTPICPFALTNRPLIVPETANIKIQLAEKSTDIMLTFDGQVGLPIDEHHTISVSKAETPVQMITLPDRDFFEILKTKLRWSGSRI
jgi:NAD+ kinase